MGLGKSLKKIAKAVVNPVGAGIEKATGIKQLDQLKIGAGVGGVMGMFGGAGGAGAGGDMGGFSPWSLVAPVIGAGADIWSARQMAQGQQEANAMTQQSAREQMAFQERMSSTSHQREVADLKAAGLNPVLSANSGASTPVGSSSEFQNAAPDYRGIVPKGVDTAIHLKTLQKQFEEIDSRIEQNRANTRNTETETEAKRPFAEIGDWLADGVRRGRKNANKLSVMTDRLINQFTDTSARVLGYTTNKEERDRRNRMFMKSFKHRPRGE